MADCPRPSGCGFFQKYQETKNLACNGFITTYCRGPSQTDCKRLEYRAKNGCAPSDDMMPTGQTIAPARP